MAWCPKCKCEYVQGITKCADCDCELVDSLQENEFVSDWDKEIAQRAMAIMMKEQASAAAEAMATNPSAAEENEISEVAKENEDETEDTAKTPAYQGRYVNHAERAEDNKMSAFVLLTVGSAGFVFVVLYFFDMLPVHRLFGNKYMVSGVMGSLFLLFIIMGIVSLRNSKILAKKAKKENNLTNEIRKWCAENLFKEQIDVSLSFEETTPEELKYFPRFEMMKELIKRQFVNLDEAYLDRLIDEIYPTVFEDGQE